MGKEELNGAEIVEGGFTVIPQRLLGHDASWDVEACPPGERIYTVLPGSNFDSALADSAIFLARTATIHLGFNDDLNHTGSLDETDPRRDLYRLAHALEHLTVIDLLKRHIIVMQRDMKIKAAKTIFSNRETGGYVGFYIRKGLVPEHEELISLQNAIDQVNASINE